MLVKDQFAELFAAWETISDADAGVLRAEFAEEDSAMAELLMDDYFELLRQQDEIDQPMQPYPDLR